MGLCDIPDPKVGAMRFGRHSICLRRSMPSRKLTVLADLGSGYHSPMSTASHSSVPRFSLPCRGVRDSRRPGQAHRVHTLGTLSQIFELNNVRLSLHQPRKMPPDCNPALISHTWQVRIGCSQAIEYRLDLLEGHDILLPCGVSGRFLPTGSNSADPSSTFRVTALKSNLEFHRRDRVRPSDGPHFDPTRTPSSELVAQRHSVGFSARK